MENKTKLSDEEMSKIFLQWKKLYVKAVVDVLKPFGNVLEVGFGDGFAAECIQGYKPKNHTIIESNQQFSQKAQEWTQKHANTQLIQEKWENAISKLGIFDTIFFNEYSEENDHEIINFLFPEANPLNASHAKEFLSVLEEQMCKLTKQFSDKDIEDFYKNIGEQNFKDLPSFFKKLKENGNISETQYENSAKKYHFGKYAEKKPAQSASGEKKTDSLLLFLEECLKNHMKKGSRFSTLLNNQTSLYENSQFFESIITNPEIEYKELSVPVKLGEKNQDALIIIVEKSF